MNLSSLAWYSRRTFSDLPFGGLLYMLLFVAITSAFIQCVDRIYKKLRSKRKKLQASIHLLPPPSSPKKYRV